MNLLQKQPIYVQSLRHYFHFLMQKHQDYKDKYYKSKIASNISLTYLLSKYMKNEEERSQIMSIFNTQILNSKKKITKEDLSYFKPLFKTVTDSELESTLIPSFIRTMKRNSIVYIYILYIIIY